MFFFIRYIGIPALQNCSSGCLVSFEVVRSCANSTFTNGASCYGSAENGCANATFTDGANCFAAGNGCAGAIIESGAFCQVGCGGAGCDGAVYLEDENGGKGCCKVAWGTCLAGSPKCATHTVTVQTGCGYTYKNVYSWDGTYW